MANRGTIYRAACRYLIALYPRTFRERFRESVEQTLEDLFRERRGMGFGIVADITEAIIREHIMELRKMSERITDPWSPATVSVVLCLPFLASALIPVFEIEPLLGVLKSLMTTDGQQLNNLGRMTVFGGVFLLPVAFLINLTSMFMKKEKSFRPRTLNLVLGLSVLSVIVMLTGWMVREAISCSRGICD